MLEYFRNDLSLRWIVLFPHCSVNKSCNSFVEMGTEFLQVLLVSIGREAFSTNPLHSVPANSKQMRRSSLIIYNILETLYLTLFTKNGGIYRRTIYTKFVK